MELFVCPDRQGVLYEKNIDWQEMCFDKYFAFNLCSRVSRNLSNQFENSASLFISYGTINDRCNTQRFISWSSYKFKSFDKFHTVIFASHSCFCWCKQTQTKYFDLLTNERNVLCLDTIFGSFGIIWHVNVLLNTDYVKESWSVFQIN